MEEIWQKKLTKIIFLLTTLCFSPQMTWRDVQDLIVQTALKTSPLDDGWKVNGAGFHFNHKFGFGRLDATAMVNKAGEWAQTGWSYRHTENALLLHLLIICKDFKYDMYNFLLFKLFKE